MTTGVCVVSHGYGGFGAPVSLCSMSTLECWVLIVFECQIYGKLCFISDASSGQWLMCAVIV